MGIGHNKPTPMEARSAPTRAGSWRTIIVVAAAIVLVTAIQVIWSALN